MLLTVLEAAAITVVFTQGTIFSKVRNWGLKSPQTHGDPYRTAAGEPEKGLLALWRELLNCPLCLGWWVGLALWGLQDAPDSVGRGWLGLVDAAGAGALSGALALLYRRITEWLDNASALADAEEQLLRKGGEQ